MSDFFDFQAGTFANIYKTELGQQLWMFLNEPVSVARMQAVSDVGKPALLGIDNLLISDFQFSERASVTEKDKPQFDRLKQMLGAMVRQVMESRGYKLQSNNVKTPSSKVFYSASLYTKN